VGIAGDNEFRLVLNGDEIVNTRTAGSPWAGSNETHKKWNIYPVEMGQGNNNLQLFGWQDDGSSSGNIAAFGCEIYDNTLEQLTAATSLSDINIIYSTSGQTTFKIVQNEDGTFESEGYQCPSGFTYSACENNCVQTLYCSGSTIV